MYDCNRSLIDLIDRNMFFCKIEKKIKYQIYQNNANTITPMLMWSGFLYLTTFLFFFFMLLPF